MNYWQRNFPPPLEVTIHGDCGFSARGEIVVAICEKVNELAEYIFGLENEKILVPSQAAGSDERMPLMFLRPCVDVLTRVILTKNLKTNPPVQMGNNMDYHFFTVWTKEIKKCINDILEEINNGQKERAEERSQITR
jgi:hypothetical protein